MFSFGSIVVIVSVLRLQYLIEIHYNRNPTADWWGPLIWSGAELFVAIICACLPATKVLATRIFTTISGKWRQHRPQKQSSIYPKHGDTPTQPVIQRPPPAMSAVSTNQISLRTSITVSSGQDHQEEWNKYPSGYAPWENHSETGSASCCERTKTTIKAGVLPQSPWDLQSSATG